MTTEQQNKDIPDTDETLITDFVNFLFDNLINKSTADNTTQQQNTDIPINKDN